MWRRRDDRGGPREARVQSDGADRGDPRGRRCFVNPGQMVGRLDTEDLDIQLQTARAMLEAARAALVQARAARDRSSIDLARQQELLKSGATAPHDADVARTNDEAAAGQVLAANAQMHQAESAVAQATLQRSYAELRAPEAGQRLAEIVRRPGDLVVLGTPSRHHRPARHGEGPSPPVDETQVREPSGPGTRSRSACTRSTRRCSKARSPTSSPRATSRRGRTGERSAATSARYSVTARVPECPTRLLSRTG